MIPRRPCPLIAILAGLLIVAGLLRFTGLDHPYTHDEFWSLGSAMGRAGEQQFLPRGRVIDNAPVLTSLRDARPIHTIWTAQRNDVHPPLYFMLLRVWVSGFGTSEFATRSLSAFLSILSVALLYDVARRLHGRGPAVWACALMAFATPQIDVAQDARPYALLTLLSLCVCAAAVRLRQSGASPARFAALGLAACAMLLTNYLAAPALLAIGLYLLLTLRGRTRVLAASTLALALLVLLVTWGPSILAQRQHVRPEEYYWLYDREAGHVIRSLRRLALLPLAMLQPPPKGTLPVAMLAAVLYVIPLVLLRRRPELHLWTLLLFVVVLPLGAMELLHSATYLSWPRYTLLASPAVYAIVGAFLWHSSRWWLRHAVPAAATLGCVLTLPAAYVVEPPDWREFAAYVDSRLGPGEPVVFAAGSYGNYFTGHLYLATAHYSRLFPRPIVLLDEPAPPETLARLRQHPTTWFVKPSPIPPSTDFLAGFARAESQFFVRVGFLERLHPVPPAALATTRTIR